MKKNLCRAVAAIAVAGAVAWPASSAAIGASAPARRPAPAPTAVEVANTNVHDELAQLAAVGHPASGVDVVRVGAPLGELFEDRRFLANVHVLQDYLNTNDAPALHGSNVAIRDVVAVDGHPDGDVPLFTR